MSELRSKHTIAFCHKCLLLPLIQTEQTPNHGCVNVIYNGILNYSISYHNQSMHSHIFVHFPSIKMAEHIDYFFSSKEVILPGIAHYVTMLSQSRVLLISIYFQLSFIQFMWFTEASAEKIVFSHLSTSAQDQGWIWLSRSQKSCHPGCIQVFCLATFQICGRRAGEGWPGSVPVACTAMKKSVTLGVQHTCRPTW